MKARARISARTEAIHVYPTFAERVKLAADDWLSVSCHTRSLCPIVSARRWSCSASSLCSKAKTCCGCDAYLPRALKLVPRFHLTSGKSAQAEND